MTNMNQLEAWLAQEGEVMARLQAGAGVGVVAAKQFVGGGPNPFLFGDEDADLMHVAA